MIKFTIKSDIPQKARQVESELDSRVHDLLNELGQELLSLEKQDFQTKSRRGAGVDGVTWKELSPVTEYLKAKKLIRKSSKGDETGLSDEQKAELKAKRKAARKRIIGIMGPHLEGTAKARGAAIQKSQIGVDTGLMRNSLAKGWTGPDGEGGNVFSIQGRSVTTGFGRTYAKWFDRARPLFPSTLPKPWEDRLEAIVERWLDRLLEGLS